MKIFQFFEGYKKKLKKNSFYLFIFYQFYDICGLLTFLDMSCILKLLNKVKSYNKFYLISNEDQLKLMIPKSF